MRYDQLTKKEQRLVNDLELSKFKTITKKEYVRVLAFLINKHKR